MRGTGSTAGQTKPNFFACSVQLCGSALVSEVTVRSAGALPLIIASTMRGDTKASGMSRRMWRSTLFSLRAISSNYPHLCEHRDTSQGQVVDAATSCDGVGRWGGLVRELLVNRNFSVFTPW